MLEERKGRVEVKLEAHNRYNKDLDELGSKLTLLRKECRPERNYYVNAEHNRLQVNAPWYGPDFPAYVLPRRMG